MQEFGGGCVIGYHKNSGAYSEEFKDWLGKLRWVGQWVWYALQGLALTWCV